LHLVYMVAQRSLLHPSHHPEVEECRKAPAQGRVLAGTQLTGSMTYIDLHHSTSSHLDEVGEESMETVIKGEVLDDLAAEQFQ
jgi:hypothetical protein